MRQVFTSHRLENVEGVEKLLNEAGIETKLTQGRSWKPSSRRSFSYSAAARQQDTGEQPAVWVLKPEDFKRAREILHEAGLLAGTREASYLPENLQFKDTKPVDPRARVNKIRMILLAATAAGGGLLVLRMLLG